MDLRQRNRRRQMAIDEVARACERPRFSPPRCHTRRSPGLAALHPPGLPARTRAAPASFPGSRSGLPMAVIARRPSLKGRATPFSIGAFPGQGCVYLAASSPVPAAPKQPSRMPRPGRRVTPGTVLHGAAQGTAASHREPRVTQVTPAPCVSPWGQPPWEVTKQHVVIRLGDKQRTRPRNNKRFRMSQPRPLPKAQRPRCPGCGTFFGPGRKRDPAGGMLEAHCSSRRHMPERRLPSCSWPPVSWRCTCSHAIAHVAVGRRRRIRFRAYGPRHRPPGDVAGPARS